MLTGVNYFCRSTLTILAGLGFLYTKLPRILAARPDVVVEVRVERIFDRMIPNRRGALVARDEQPKANRGRPSGSLR